MAVLREHGATVVMTASERAMMRLLDKGVLSPQMALQDLYADETAPAQGRRDAAQEEIHHLIVGFGWAKVFADRFDDLRGPARLGAG